jgi:phosphoenolpyruvate synthase/pyruvate phosphate dikinase
MEFVKIVERENAPLFLNLICHGMTDKQTKSTLGFNLGYSYYVYLDNSVYITKESEKEIHQKLMTVISNEGFSVLNDFANKWEKLGEKLISDTKNIDFDNLKKSFLQIKEDYYKMSTSIMLPVSIEKILEQKLKTIVDNDSDLVEITRPDRMNDNEKEAIALRNIIDTITKDKLSINSSEVENLIKGHIKEFGWMNSGRVFKDSWTINDIRKRIKFNTINETDEGSDKQFNLSVEDEQIVNTAKHYVYLRTYRMNTFMKASFLMKPLLMKISEKLGISFSDIIHMTPEEIIDALDGTDLPDDKIEERKIKYGYYVINEEINTISGPDFDTFNKKVKVTNDNQIKDLKGSTAYKGIVTGDVKIVRTVKEISKVKKGDILVAPMTIPMFLPAMERAAAFITDEGGILCHAAIIARELRKPCIIGTRNATTLLKDGDTVEVDADKGVVTLIEQP